MAISALVGNCSSPLWYWWKIAAVRPVLASNVFSASSRGVSEKPPAAAPQRTPQDGTSFASTAQSPGAGVTTGAGVASGTVGTVTAKVGWPDVASAERKCAESLVAVEVTANVYVPAPLTTELTSKVTVVSAAAGLTDLMSAPTAGSFL